MKRKLILLMIMIISMFMLVSCGENVEEPDKKDVKKALEKENIIAEDEEYELVIEKVKLNDDEDEATVICTIEKADEMFSKHYEYEVVFSLDEDEWEFEEIDKKEHTVKLNAEISDKAVLKCIEGFEIDFGNCKICLDDVDLSIDGHNLDKEDMMDTLDVSFVWYENGIPYYYEGTITYKVNDEYEWFLAETDVESEQKIVIERDAYMGIEVDEDIATITDEELQEYIQSDLEANADENGNIPELTDEYVQAVYSYLGISTVEEYMEEYRSTIVLQDIYEVVWPEIIENIEIIGYDYDEVHNLVELCIEELESNLIGYEMDLEDYLEYIEMTKEDLELEYLNSAIDDAVYCEVRDYIATAENISVSDEEYIEELSKTMVTYEFDTEEEFYEYFGAYGYDEEYFRDNFLTNKVVEFICENIVVK